MINYNILAESVSYYSNRGYQQIETPWVVSEKTLNLTRPLRAKDYYIFKEPVHKGFVASGEQGFLYLAAKGMLPPGTYQTVTPCLRCDEIDEFHTRCFVKNELINTVAPTVHNLEQMIFDSQCFFERYLKNVKVTKLADVTFDIECDGIELGSYGIRRCNFLDWIYGTGVALPRLSRVIKQQYDRQK